MSVNVKKDLYLSLKTEWFNLTKSGIKTEDYRSINGYWVKRLILLKQENIKIKDIIQWIDDKDLLFFNKMCSFKPFTNNIMTLGYPKSTDSDRILKLEHKGIEIRTGNPAWGAEPNKLYFVIMHGQTSMEIQNMDSELRYWSEVKRCVNSY